MLNSLIFSIFSHNLQLITILYADQQRYRTVGGAGLLPAGLRQSLNTFRSGFRLAIKKGYALHNPFSLSVPFRYFIPLLYPAISLPFRSVFHLIGSSCHGSSASGISRTHSARPASA